LWLEATRDRESGQGDESILRLALACERAPVGSLKQNWRRRPRRSANFARFAWTVNYADGVCTTQDFDQTAFVRAVRWQPL
jgi:hypothetical protein